LYLGGDRNGRNFLDLFLSPYEKFYFIWGISPDANRLKNKAFRPKGVFKAVVDLSEFFKNVSIICSCISVIYGIAFWRIQFLGKRKIEIAEEVLCKIYEIREQIKYIRNPFSWQNEGKTRERDKNETEEISGRLDMAYVVFERYNKKIDVFNSFFSLKYRYIAVFGKKYERPFNIMNKVLGEIFSSARLLGTIYWKNQGRPFRSEEKFQNHLKEMEKYENIFWEHSEDDNINTKVNEAIAICEEVCHRVNSAFKYKKIIRTVHLKKRLRMQNSEQMKPLINQ
jgi:hypothetical protein